MILLVIIYLVIGAFIAGVLDEDEPGWVTAIVMLWPIVLGAILGIIALTKPYELGKKLLNKKKEQNTSG